MRVACFRGMTEVQLRKWLEANPKHLNAMGDYLWTPLYTATILKSLPLVLWLLDEKGADVNKWANGGERPLHAASTLVLNALLDRGANPTLKHDWSDDTPLMTHVSAGRIDMVTRLLQDPRVRATINLKGYNRNTALHYGSEPGDKIGSSIIHLLLQAGANSYPMNLYGWTPLADLRRNHCTHHTSIALLDQAPNAKKAFLIVKGRRLIVAATSKPIPSYLQGRVGRGEPLPCVVLIPPLESSHTEDEDEEGRKFRSMLAFLLGMQGGPTDEGMPRDVFRIVMDLLMSSWDPLRRGVATLQV